MVKSSKVYFIIYGVIHRFPRNTGLQIVLSTFMYDIGL